MAKWLDKYEQGGMVLKQKTKDNYGKQSNYNDAKVSTPPGYVGMGYDTKGRNYSPAWGGQFAMGGYMPGAVGFTYARTAGSAPANGKYAKKTKASAQNGKEMSFYQNGLDFTPKTISKNGSVIKDDRGQWAHPGEITEIGSNDITMQGVDYPVLGVSDTGDTQMMQPGENYKFKGKKVTEYPMAQDGIYTVKDIMKMKSKPKEKYELTQGVKNLKATLSAIDLATLPAIETPWGFIANRTAGIANSVGDAYTAARYAIDGQWDNAAVDAGEAVLDLIPLAKGKRVINLAKNSNLPSVYNKLSKVDKSLNRGLKVLKAGAYGDDFQDVVPESYKNKKQNGGWLNKYK